MKPPIDARRTHGAPPAFDSVRADTLRVSETWGMTHPYAL